MIQRWRIVECKHCHGSGEYRSRKCSWCNGYGKHPQFMTYADKDREWYYTKDEAEAQIRKEEA